MEYNLWSSIWSGANNNNNNSNMRIEDIGRQMYINSNGGNVNTPVHATLLTGTKFITNFIKTLYCFIFTITYVVKVPKFVNKFY